jgi:hypothetical protein
MIAAIEHGYRACLRFWRGDGQPFLVMRYMQAALFPTG